MVKGLPSTDVAAILGDHVMSSDVEKFTFLTPINTNKTYNLVEVVISLQIDLITTRRKHL